MRKLTCRQFRGPCDTIVQGNTADEASLAEFNHVHEQIEANDVPHFKFYLDTLEMNEEEKVAWKAKYTAAFESAIEVPA